MTRFVLVSLHPRFRQISHYYTEEQNQPDHVVRDEFFGAIFWIIYV